LGCCARGGGGGGGGREEDHRLIEYKREISGSGKRRSGSQQIKSSVNEIRLGLENISVNHRLIGHKWNFVWVRLISHGS
jgi:hypothetical protein